MWNHGDDKDGRFRGGKTASDKKGGQSGRNTANKQARAAWENGTEKQFPVYTCGGKGNSSRPYKMMGGRGRVQV